MARTPSIARSAKSGRFVTRKYAERHPATTVIEQRRPAKKKPRRRT